MVDVDTVQAAVSALRTALASWRTRALASVIALEYGGKAPRGMSTSSMGDTVMTVDDDLEFLMAKVDSITEILGHLEARSG